MLPRRLFRRRRLCKRQTSITAHYRKYRPVAELILRYKVDYWNQVLRYPVKRITIRNQRSRWGSCSAAGNVNLNYKLIFLPEELLDYVVVHELCHLIELNHSPAFWKLVEDVLPQYRVYQCELRAYERDLKLDDKYLEQYHKILHVLPKNKKIK